MPQSDEHDERTMEPTAQRLAQARREGEVVRSGDLTAAIVLTGAMLLLGAAGGPLLDAMTNMTAKMLDFRTNTPARVTAGEVLGGAAGVLTGAGLLAGAIVIVAVAANVLQVGLLAVGRLASPDFSRLSPGKGVRRMLGRRACVRALAALAKLIAVGGIAYLAIRWGLAEMAALARARASELAGGIGRIVWRAGMAMSAALLVLGALDWLYQRWEFRREHRMTPREVAEELENTQTQQRLRRPVPQGPKGKDSANA